MQIVDGKIEKYLVDLYGTAHEVLRKMEAEACKSDFPIVGPLVGKLFFQLAKLVNARRVFEMGSGFGYSAFWWALAMDGGEIHCTERSEANRQKAEEYFRESGLLGRVRYHVGDALEEIEKVEGSFDIVLIDLDKPSYPAALEKALPRIRKGGLLVADNVLWSGKVAGKNRDESTLAIKRFNEKLFSKKELAASIVPVRDGVAVAYKTQE